MREDDAWYDRTSLYNDPLLIEYFQKFPEDTIPGWYIQLRICRQNPDEDSKIFFFHASRVKSSPYNTYFDIRRVVSNSLWETGDHSTIVSEVIKLGIKEIRAEVTRWMVENDESCRVLQRVLNYGLSSV